MDAIQEIIGRSVAVKQALLNDENLMVQIRAAVDLISATFKKNGGRVYFCGNGGSAADAQHLAAELSGSFYDRQRKALPAEALHGNSSYLTAVANDFSYDHVFSRLVYGYMKKDDVLVGLSTSGNSMNIVEAFKAAKQNGIKTIGFTGKSGGKLRSYSDILLNMPSEDTPRIQECHMLLGHIICQLVEAELFAE